MSRQKIKFYDEATVEYQLKYYQTLTEKQRRYFLAFEYLKLGNGSQHYLAEIFGCSRQTIVDGVKEVLAPDFVPDYTRQRCVGGGRKKKNKPM